MKPAKIWVKSFKSDAALLWFNRKDKWRVTCTNLTNAAIFVSWDEIDRVTTDLTVVETEEAGRGMIGELTGGVCRSYLHAGSATKRIAPHRFLEIQIRAGESAEWTMEKPSQSHRYGFSIRSVSIWEAWSDRGTIIASEARVEPEAE